MRRFDAIPDIHTYRGLSLRVTLGCRLRILAKYIIQRMSLTREERVRLRVLAPLAGSRRGRSALIVAGGPSSGRLDPIKVRRAQHDSLDVFAMNMYNRSTLASSVIPDFYAVCDPQFFEASEDGQLSDAHQSVWDYLLTSGQGTRLILPFDRAAPDSFKDRILWFNNLGLEGWSKNVNPLRARGYSDMVAFSTVAIALFLGYDRIYVAGIDNSMFKSVRKSPEGRFFYGPGTHHHASVVDVAEVGNARGRNFYRGGVAAYFEDVARLFAELHLFSSERIRHLDPESLVDAFTGQVSFGDVDLTRDEETPSSE